MQKGPPIHNLYKPVQPAVKPGHDTRNIIYREVRPDTRLQRFIYCYWQLKTETPLDEPFTYRVVADGCIDIFFDNSNPEENFLMGFSTAYKSFGLGHSFSYTGIRFLPASFPQLFKIDASDLTNRFEYLGQVAPDISGFISDRFDESNGLKMIKSSFDGFFLNIINNSDFHPDIRIQNALEVILGKRGNLRIEKDLNIGLSHRQLRRLFNQYIGAPVKTFSKIARFQNCLMRTNPGRKLHTDNSYFDAGYYDQAHFIKEFKTLYGITPAGIFEKSSNKS